MGPGGVRVSSISLSALKYTISFIRSQVIIEGNNLIKILFKYLRTSWLEEPASLSRSLRRPKNFLQSQAFLINQ